MAGKSEISFDQLMNDLKNKIYHPIYFLQGEESYFIDLISDYIEQNVLNELEKEFNQTIVYGKDSNVQTIISYARRFPMMANYQVLIVKEVQELDRIEELQLYAENPLKSTILVLCYKYAKLDKRKTFYKSIEKQGVIFESNRFYDNKIPDWISHYLQGLNYSINPKAAALLTEFLGADLGKIVNEIRKLLINLDPGSTITEEDIEKNIGISKDYNVFELQKALAQKDVVKSNRIILHFAANPRENPLVKVIPILFSFFSKILTYHYLSDKSRNSAAAALSVNPFFVSDYQQAARSFPVPRVMRIISILREYDLKSKGVDSNATYAGDGELMKELIFKILH
ncbi:MAG: DNA polymerase III subunit delta [Bacteroidales bacterium]|nr:DNA polymerase III subunit delta [Bacteroidales bacterium]